jgi:hypothetical protein
MKVSHDFRQTMVPLNVWGAFHALGLDLDTRSEPYWLLFDQEKWRGSAGFREQSTADVPLNQSSSRDVLLGPVGSISRGKMA